MTQASGSSSQILIQPESVWGEIPTTRKSQIFSNSLYGESLASQSSELVSQAINPNRGVSDTRNGQLTVSGSIPVELSVENSDLLFYLSLGAYTQTKVGDKFVKVYKRNKTLPSFTIEKGFTDIDQYFQFLGCRSSTLQFAVEPDGLVTGSMEIMGKEEQHTTASIDQNATYIDHEAYAGIDNVILEGGKQAFYTAFNISITNGLYDSRAIGTRKSVNIGAGKGEVTGDLTIMFEDVTMYEKWLNEEQTNIKLTFQIGDNSVVIEFPRIKFNGSASPVIASAEGITQQLNFRGLVDKTEKSDVIITVTNDFDLTSFLTPDVTPPSGD